MDEKQGRQGSLKTNIMILSLLPVFILGIESVCRVYVFMDGKVDAALFKTVVTQINIFMVCTLVIACIVVTILVRRMVAALTRMSDALTKLADGDLTTEIMEKDLAQRNEIGMIARSVRLLSTKLRGLVSEISETSDTLRASAGDMEQIADSTAKAADNVTANMQEITAELTDQSQQTENVAADVEQIGRMIEQSTGALSNLRNDMAAIQTSSMSGMETVEELEAVDEDVRSRMDVIARQTNTTNSSAQQIQEATELIASIAEETNLLALNASIEAARAGEQGRGFAVVADQIQKLAEQSNQSAAAIDKVVQGLLIDAGNAVTTMNEIWSSIKKQNQTVAEVKNAFSTVSEGINRSVQEIESIADNTKCLNEAKKGLIGASENLNAISQNSLAITEETSSEAEELNSSITIVNESAGRLKTCADELAQEMDYFKM